MAPTRKRKKVEPLTLENLPVPSLTVPSNNNTNLKSPHHHAQSIKDQVLKAKSISQRELREQLRQLRHELEVGRQSGQNPLYLFPQEIWLMIFNNLDNIKDLAQCAQSCTLFSTIIGPPQEVLFVKVLPFLFPHFSYQTQVVETCGKVCRKWRAGVDRFADSAFRIKSPISSSLEALKKESEPYSADRLQTHAYQLMPELRAGETIQIEAPFLVAFQISLSSQQPNGPPTNLTRLDSIGRLAWLLHLKVDAVETYNTQQLYRWCAKAIGSCRNLRTFCFFEETFSRTTIQDNGIGDEVIEEVKSSSLETLQIMDENPNLVGVQDELLRHLSDQLKFLKIRIWNDQLYHNLSWTNLTELHIIAHDNRSALLTSLVKTRAPNLNKILLKMDSTCDFIQLFKALNNFGKSLRHLFLSLTRGFNPESVLSVPMESLTGVGIQSLEIMAHNLNQSRNIPVLFPLVQNLTWWHGPTIVADPSSFDDPKTNERFDKPNYHLIQIFNNMYKSNVWTVLPQLQTLTMGYASRCSFKEEGRTSSTQMATELKKFTRSIYIWKTEKYGEGIQNLLGRIQTVVMADAKEVVKRERDGLKIVAVQTRNKVWPRKTPQRKMKQLLKEDMQNFEQVFAFVVPFLANSDLMACRLVSKTWKRLVGGNYQTSDLALSLGLPMTQNKRDKFTREFNCNKQNPYFAHHLHLQLKKWGNKANEVQKLLPKLGTHIHHLTISSFHSLDLVEIYKIFTKCLKYCTNLESLTLHIKVVKGSSEKEFKKWVNAAMPLVLPKRFETLAVSGPDSTYRDAVLNLFLDKVMEKCRDQITILRQDQSSKPEAIKEMPKLKELTIRKFSTDVGSLLKLKWYWPVAPNLNKLHICVTGQKISYQDLICIAKNYQKLEFLEIQFTECCGGFSGCLKYCDPAKTILKVSELKIVLTNKSQICLDFLVLFPYVKTLSIVYGKHAKFFNEESTWQPQVKYGDLKPSCSLPERKPENDYIQLAKYLKDADMKGHDSHGIYGSNIWTVLRRLRELKVVYCATEQNKGDSRVFYRQL